MLRKEHRLSERKEISSVFRFGKRIYGDVFLFAFSPNELPVSRFSVICGKKFFSLATKRNSMRRLVRETLRQILPRVKPGYDGVFVFTQKPEKTPDFAKIFSEVETLLFRARLLL